MKRALGIVLAAAMAIALPVGRSTAAPGADPLARGFAHPPDAAKPRVWWHWMNGNVTKEGITADLEAMKRIGIGGFQMFDAHLSTPVMVEKPVKYMTPEWLQMLRHAAAEAKRLGLEMTMHASAGWSETGGPWVTPAQAMQKLVWSEVRVTGPRPFSGSLPPPPSVFGTYQGLVNARLGKTPPTEDPHFFSDVAVIAFRSPPGSDVRLADLAPRVTSNAKDFDGRVLVDGDPNTRVVLVPPAGATLTVEIALDRPLRARAFTVQAAGVPPVGELQASLDGQSWKTIAPLPIRSHMGRPAPKTIAFAPISARRFRLAITPPPANAKPLELAEIDLLAEPRVHRFEDKAAFAMIEDYAPLATAAVAPGEAIFSEDIVNLTSRMERDGRLTWDVPTGNWTILRLGHSPTGKKNGPAPVEGTGLECDKLDAAAVTAYFDGFIKPIAAALGPLLGKSLKYVLIDSWEADVQNFTPNFLAEFARRRGYDPMRYLPVMTGRIVTSAEVSDRFLSDVRRTIADLVAEKHYGTFADLLHKRGLGLYSEAVGTGMPMFADQLETRGRTDIPMGEFWVPAAGETLYQWSDSKEAASAGHIYGKTIVAAESFTAAPSVPAWGRSPFALKTLGDLHLAAGINRIVIHEYAHQPLANRKPGFTLGPYGTQFGRTITWWEQAVAWMSYFSRSQFLLQQGLPVSDLLYFYGESIPAQVPGRETIDPEPPEGYDYDYVNTDVLLHRLSVEKGRLRLPDGVSYSALVLPPLRAMSVEVARKIRALVEAGATVVGAPPRKAVGLTGYPESDVEVKRLADEMWGPCDGKQACEHPFGGSGGKTVIGKPLREILAASGQEADFECKAAASDARFVFIHRRTSDADIYFVANQKERPETADCRFRVDGKIPELWDPDTGHIETARHFSTAGGRTTIPLHFDPAGSLFVVFRKPGKPDAATGAKPDEEAPAPLLTVPGPWQVTFPPGLGAPATITLAALTSWTENPDDGVRYFSGTAGYATDVTLPAQPKGQHILLDLGEVKEIAEVSVNGKRIGILWKPPFRIDVTNAARPGRNRLEVKITNLWPNRLIGDAKLPEDKRITWTTHSPYTKESPLLPSGLLGPVQILTGR